MVQKQVSAEHRDGNEMARTGPTRPLTNRRQKRLVSLRRQLVVHELLAVAGRPQCEPLTRVYWQGFAPFGLVFSLKTEPFDRQRKVRATVRRSVSAAPSMM
jgi:hypothetical protein